MESQAAVVSELQRRAAYLAEIRVLFELRPFGMDLDSRFDARRRSLVAIESGGVSWTLKGRSRWV